MQVPTGSRPSLAGTRHRSTAALDSSPVPRSSAGLMRTVGVAIRPDASLLRALYDVRSMVNQLIPQWRARSEESRFSATKRSYAQLRALYPHLGSKWVVVACNETSATLTSWDRALRRARRQDPVRFERMRSRLPRRTRLKASLHPSQYRVREHQLELTVHRRRHVNIDLSQIRNPLFARYWAESGGKFGLSVTDRHLLFHFHTPDVRVVQADSVGVDLNMPSMDYATSDGLSGSVDLRQITRLQGAMARKRASIQRAISKDIRHQRAVLRRYQGRERRRVTPLLHEAANRLLAVAGRRNLILEDLRSLQDHLNSRPAPVEHRRRLASWTRGALDRILTYKSQAQVVHVNPRGTSSECPQCGGSLTHPSWRKATCGTCLIEFHRDRMAAVAVLIRGESIIWGAAHPPNALNALLESARWRPTDAGRTGLIGETAKGDEAKPTGCKGS